MKKKLLICLGLLLLIFIPFKVNANTTRTNKDFILTETTESITLDLSNMLKVEKVKNVEEWIEKNGRKYHLSISTESEQEGFFDLYYEEVK